MTNPATGKALYEVYKDGSSWAFKTPHGIEKRRTKRAAIGAATAWKDANKG